MLRKIKRVFLKNTDNLLIHETQPPETLFVLVVFLLTVAVAMKTSVGVVDTPGKIHLPGR